MEEALKMMLNTYLLSLHEKSLLLILQSKQAFHPLLHNFLIHDTHVSHENDTEQSDGGDEVFEER